MAKPINSFPEKDRKAVAIRRLESKTYGIGFWSAFNWCLRNGVNPLDILEPKRSK